MKTTVVAILLNVLLMIPSRGAADDMPREGTFTSYFFVDRWKQPRFDIFYVEPRFSEELSAKGWRPLVITSKNIHQCGNPGGAMIREIERVEIVGEVPLQIELELPKSRVRYGGAAKLAVKVKNLSDRRVEVYRRDLLLNITVHERGRLPRGDPPRDVTYDSQKDPYYDWQKDADTRAVACARFFLRSTSSVPLFTDPGEISMLEGSPDLYIDKGGERKGAGLYDEVKTVIAPRKSAPLGYRIGSGWLVNEYELQVQYRLPSPRTVVYILSRPIPFDVTR